MLHFSPFINWNASERNNELAFKQFFFIPDREKIELTFYLISNHRTELAFPSYENQKEKNFQGFC